MKIRIVPLFTCTMIVILFLVPRPGKGQAERRESSPFESAEICANCHESISKAWRKGPHADSWKSVVYHAARAGYVNASSGGGMLHCEACHAPVAYRTGDVHLMEPVSTEGVTCDACHTLRPSPDDPGSYEPAGGKVKAGPSGDCAATLHRCRREPFLSNPGFCASCHYYVNPSGIPMYTEYLEWKEAGSDPDRWCDRCHVEKSDGKPGAGGAHAFVPLRGPGGLLARALLLYIDLQRAGEVVINVRVRNSGAAHAVPGGPPIRAISLDVRGYNDMEKEVFSDSSRVFARTIDSPVSISFGMPVPWLGWAESSDTRIYPGETKVARFSTGRTDIVRATARLIYRRFDVPREVAREFFGESDFPVMATASALVD